MKRLVIGITGGIATGKSAVLKELRRGGVPTISSDDLAHACLRPGHPVYTRVVRRFGRTLVGPRKLIDRSRLGRIVFSVPQERKWLEKQIHPWVIRGLRAFIRKHRRLTALDIPLLFEAHLEKLVDVVVVVTCSETTQIARLKRRNGLDRRAALQRIRAQWPLAAKQKRADYVIRNESTPAALRQKTTQLLNNLTSLRSHV